MLDQDARPLRFYDDLIKGRIVVISFMYTSCNSICPLAIARLAEVQERLRAAAGRDYHFISISIDPIPDTPERLKEHAKVFGVGPGWTFVTGEPANVDLIRWKLGERSGAAITLHKNEVLIYNDVTGEWNRDSAFSDIDQLARTISIMDPAVRAAESARPPQAAPAPHESASLGLPGQALFIKACASCHTIGEGRKVGPDLSGLTIRRDRDWIVRYLMAPDRLRKANDPTALALRREYPTVRMPTLSLSEDDIADLLSYIERRPKAAENGPAPGPSHH
jgi:protein SCO1/2